MGMRSLFTSSMEAIRAEGLVTEQCVLMVIILRPIFTACKQENIVPNQDPLSSRKNASSNEETITMTLDKGVISTPVRSPTSGVRTVSFLMDHQLELGIRALQAAQLLDQEPTFWSMQG